MSQFGDFDHGMVYYEDHLLYLIGIIYALAYAATLTVTIMHSIRFP